MTYTIRRAKPADAEGIIAAHRRSIREVCYKDYTPAQIAAWSGRNFQVEHWHDTIPKDLVWVVVDTGDKIYGFGHLHFRPDSTAARLAGLYFVPEVLGVGHGRALVRFMKAACRQRGCKSIDLVATITSKAFYEKMDFQQVGEITTMQMQDQWIECYNMAQSL
jgi:putative acetyltransferase